MMFRKQWQWLVAMLPLMAGTHLASGQLQSQNPGIGLDQGYSGQASPCDERYQICVDSQGRPLNTTPAQGVDRSSSGFSDADARYEFGNGLPLDFGPRDYRRSSSNQMPSPAPIRFAPEPLTEFQKFVASDTGKVLPIFGARLFRDVPGTFAPLDRVPVPANYVVGPGDSLLLRAWGSIAFYMRVTVDRDGNIYIPHIGTLQIAGIKFVEMHDY